MNQALSATSGSCEEAGAADPQSPVERGVICAGDSLPEEGQQPQLQEECQETGEGCQEEETASQEGVPAQRKRKPSREGRGWQPGAAPAAPRPARAGWPAWTGQLSVLAVKALEAEEAEGYTLWRHNGEPTKRANRVIKASGQAAAQARQQSHHEVQSARRALVGVGRPSSYTEDRGDSIVRHIAAGGSLRAWCEAHRVGFDTVYRWRDSQPVFRERYESALRDRADTLADELLEIADAPPLSGDLITMEEVAHRKLQIETRKWIASKLQPQRWGEARAQAATAEAVVINIGIPAAQPTVLDAATGEVLR